MLVADMLNVLEIKKHSSTVKINLEIALLTIKAMSLFAVTSIVTEIAKKGVVIQFQYYQIAAAREGGVSEWIIVFLSAALHN